MNILLWIVQAVLALFCLAGGSYKVFHFDEIAKMPQTMALSRGGWGALGIFEMLCAVLLVVPGVAKWMPVLTRSPLPRSRWNPWLWRCCTRSIRLQ
jgi:DoxX-like family